MILPDKLKQDSEDTVETGIEKISFAMIDRTGNVSLWSFHQRSKSKSCTYAVTLSQSRYADSSHTQGAAEEVGTEEGPTTQRL